MTIQWYPGHMHKAQKAIKQALPKVDLIIEVIDARIPYSSSNPLIDSFANSVGLNKPIIKVMNKTDLADSKITQVWRDYFERQHAVKALPVSSYEPEQVKKITGLCRKLMSNRVEKALSVRAMIMGIPNVGKSTIINLLSGRNIAKVGNEPAVTRRQQRIDLPDNVTLFDTPGILWPKIDNIHSRYRLAISGAIRDTVLAYDDIAFYALEYFADAYPDKLIDKFQLPGLDQETLETIEMIGRKRGCLVSGGRVDLDKVCKIIVHEFRQARLGKMSLETPAMIEQELIKVAEQRRLRAENKASRKKSFKKRSAGI